MSSRDIEGENPLYLPQAKVYSNSCALGPCIVVRDRPLPESSEIEMEIIRDGVKEFHGQTSLANLKRTPRELVEYLFRDNSFPNGCFLLTGTGIVPPEDFTVHPGDEVRWIAAYVPHILQQRDHLLRRRRMAHRLWA